MDFETVTTKENTITTAEKDAAADVIDNEDAVEGNTREQIASFLSTKETKITLQYANVQKQPNDCDCGLFAIAFAMAICNGQTPEEELFGVTRMREHLYDCIENKMMKHFQAKKRRCTNKTRKIETLKVFCHCRL